MNMLKLLYFNRFKSNLHIKKMFSGKIQCYYSLREKVSFLPEKRETFALCHIIFIIFYSLFMFPSIHYMRVVWKKMMCFGKTFGFVILGVCFFFFAMFRSLMFYMAFVCVIIKPLSMLTHKKKNENEAHTKSHTSKSIFIYKGI